MLNKLLNLTKIECKNYLKEISFIKQKEIFNNVHTLTKELDLNKITDYETRIKMRYEHIQKFPNEVFWDHVEYQEYGRDQLIIFKNMLISTKGDLIKKYSNGKINITSSITSRYCHALVFLNKTNKLINRAVASTFIPKPEKYELTEYGKLQARYVNKDKGNDISNIKWERGRGHGKNINNAYGNFEDIEFYYLFEVVINNQFKGRRFIIPHKDIHQPSLFKRKTNTFPTNGFLKGMCFKRIIKSEVDNDLLGYPDDIRIYNENNNRIHNNTLIPVIGEVLIGKYKGLLFSLYSYRDSFGLFTKSQIDLVLDKKNKHHKGCLFRKGTADEIKKYHGNFTKEVADDLIASRYQLCIPLIGTVLEGKHKGLQFSLFGKNDAERYFNYSLIHNVIRGAIKSHSNCTWRKGTLEEGLKYRIELNDLLVSEIKTP